MMTDDNPLAGQGVHVALAALRFMQANLHQLPDEIRAIATNDGEFSVPSTEEIDALCAFINFDLPIVGDRSR